MRIVYLLSVLTNAVLFHVRKVRNPYYAGYHPKNDTWSFADRTLRTYLFPDLKPHLILRGHRAAVNAVAISDNLIVSASGDRSMAVWDANTGQLIRAFENHH